MNCCQCPPTSLPLCRRPHMSRCRQCRPADALGATAPSREASSGGGPGGVGWELCGVGSWGGWAGGGGVLCGGTYTRHRYHALPNRKNTQALSFGGFAPGLSYPWRPSNRTLAGAKTGGVWGGRVGRVGWGGGGGSSRWDLT